MFEIGDKVLVTSFVPPKEGVIIKWFFDEGNVWVVRVEDQAISTFGDCEMIPAPTK